MKPSGKFEGLGGTPLHDKIHLWVSKNISGLVWSTCMGLTGWDDVDCKYSKIEVEKPLYNGNYLQGICDGVIDIGNIYDNGSSIFRRVIYEIKPKLTSISQAVGQIKSYAQQLKYGEHNDEDPYMVIVTLDTNNEYDDMIKSQGIHVYRIPKETLN